MATQLDLIRELAASEMRLRRLAEEIGRTARRVTALDNILIVAALLIARVGQQGRDDGGSAGGQRSPRWPDVQRADVAVTHVLCLECSETSLRGRLLRSVGGWS